MTDTSCRVPNCHWPADAGPDGLCSDCFNSIAWWLLNTKPSDVIRNSLRRIRFGFWEGSMMIEPVAVDAWLDAGMVRAPNNYIVDHDDLADHM